MTPPMTAMVHIVPDGDAFGSPTETHVVNTGGEVAVEFDGPGFSLRFRDLDHLDAWLTGVRHDVDALMARRYADPVSVVALADTGRDPAGW